MWRILKRFRGWMKGELQLKKLRYLLGPLVIILLIIPTINLIYTKKCERVLAQKDITSIKHQYNNIIRDRGGILKDYMITSGDLMLQGSSELSSTVDQNPIHVFPFKDAEYDVTILGRAYTQSLQEASILNSTNGINEKSKIALIVSLQWFEKEAGLDGEDYSVNFSEYQFYKMMNSNKISNENKEYYAKRNYELLSKGNEFTEEKLYAGLHAKDDFISKMCLVMIKPYYKFKEYILDTKDKVLTYNLVSKLPNNNECNNIKNLDWNEEYSKAEGQGEKNASGNHLKVDDEYYNKYLKDIYYKLEGTSKDVDLVMSKEIDDYEYFLKVSKELGVKPLIIITPAHGSYYDYLGLNREKRLEYYKTIENMAKEYGFDVLNLQDKEYEEYYLKDVMHLGWKGWLNINEEIFKYYKER